MPKLTFSSTAGIQTIGPLAAGTDFQVKEGRCFVALESPGSDNTLGFERFSGETFYVGAGKTIYLQTANFCHIYYGALA